MKTDTKELNNIEIAIIGAGLGGLCLAQGLKKNGISFQVFEKDLSASSRTQGYRIRIDQNGQHALENCLPSQLYQVFKNTSIRSERVHTLTSQLETQHKWIDSWKDHKAALPDLKVNRGTLREILLHGLSDHVYFNKNFKRYEKLEDGRVSVHFEDETSFTADILVAADGINSILGALRFPENQVKDTGSICIYGKTFYTDTVKMRIAEALQRDTTVIFDKELAMISDAMTFDQTAFTDQDSGLQLNFAKDYIYWALIGNRNRFGLNNEHNLRCAVHEYIPLLQKAISDWHPDLKALFELSELETLALVPVKTSLPKCSWVTDQITALGDAIHAMSPAGGLGANTALYDASLLTQHLSKALKEKTDLLTSISDYEQQMLKHSTHAVNASQKGSKELYETS